MSYIIAHVAFDKSGKTYPVNCERTDVAIGDEVIVKMNGRPLKRARVVDLNYLNWECQHMIECLAREAEFSQDGITLPPGESLSVKGLARPYDLAVRLFKLGWMPRRPVNRAYRLAYSATNLSKTGLIMMRKNGIDIQIIEGLPLHEIRPNSGLSTSRTDGPFIGQPYHGSFHNVFERIASFAEAFLRNEKNLEDMITPLATDKILPSPPQRARLDGDDLYSALGGMGAPIYLSDGVWLSSGGGAHDWGR